MRRRIATITLLATTTLLLTACDVIVRLHVPRVWYITVY